MKSELMESRLKQVAFKLGVKEYSSCKAGGDFLLHMK